MASCYVSSFSLILEYLQNSLLPWKLSGSGDNFKKGKT